MNSIDNKSKVTRNPILYLLPLIGIFGILVPVIIGKFNFAILGSYIAIPCIITPFLYSRTYKKISPSIELKDNFLLIFLNLYFICALAIIFIVSFLEIRPILFYIIVTFMSLILLLEILLFRDSKRKTLIILFQLMLLVPCLLWSVNLNYYYYISRTDPIFHVNLIDSLINNSHMNTEIFDVYKSFPLWHILCTFIYHMSALELPTHKIMFLTNGIIYSFIPVLIYLISNKIFGNDKVSLTSALFVVIDQDVIGYGMASIPRSVVSFLFLLQIFTLLFTSNLKLRFISVLLIFPIVAYHTASTPFIISIFLLIYVGNYYYQNNDTTKFITFNYIGIVTLITLFYWIYYADSIFKMIIQLIISEAPSGVLTKSIIITPFNELFNYTQYSFLLFFIILGILAAVSSNKIEPAGKIFCILGLLSVVVVFPGPTLLFNKLSGDLNIGRFGQYFYPFISLTAAFGFIAIYNATTKYSKSIILILFICLVFLSISNDFVASDNPIIKRPFYTYYLTEPEITSFSTIGNFSHGKIMSDYVTIRFFSLTKDIHSNSTHILEIDSENMLFLKEKNDDILLIRTGELSKRPLKLYTNTLGIFKLNPSWEGGAKMSYYYNDLVLWENLESYKKIYDNKKVQAFI